MKKLILSLILALPIACSSLYAQFPASVASRTTLLNANNFFQSKLATPISASATTITLSDTQFTLIFPTILAVENEIIKVCSQTGNVITVCSNGRGFDSSQATSHAQGMLLKASSISAYHNIIADELIAVENQLATTTKTDAGYTSLSTACSDAGAGYLTIRRNWLNVPAQTLSCGIIWDGGTIQPASSVNGSTPIKFTGPWKDPGNIKLFDMSIAGSTAAIQLYHRVGKSNPIWFGADPVGTLDSTPAFQAAVDAARGDWSGAYASSVPVIFPAGYFRWMSTVKLWGHDNLHSLASSAYWSMTFQGAGPYSSFIGYYGASNTDALFISGHFDTISGFALQNGGPGGANGLGWNSGLHYTSTGPEGSGAGSSATTFSNLNIDCQYHTGDGIQIGTIGGAQSDQSQWITVNSSNCKYGSGIIMLQPNTQITNLLGVGLSFNWIGFNMFTSDTTVSLSGITYEYNILDTNIGQENNFTINSSRSEGAYRSLFLASGGNLGTTVSYNSYLLSSSRSPNALQNPFDRQARGATTAAMISGQGSLVFTPCGNYIPGDIISVPGAGPAGAVLQVKLASMVDSCHATSFAVASTTVTNASISLDTSAQQDGFVLHDGRVTFLSSSFLESTLNTFSAACCNSTATATFIGNTWGDNITTPYGVFPTPPGTILLNNSYNCYQSNCKKMVDSGIYVPDTAFTVLSDACIYAKNTANKPLQITQTWTGLTSQTCQADLIFSGGLLNVASGQTLILSGSILPTLTQIFSGSGIIKVSGNNAALFPEWWGAGTTSDDTFSFNAALTNAVFTGIPVKLLPKQYNLNTATSGVILNIPNIPACSTLNNPGSFCGLVLIGAGSNLTTLKTTLASADLFSYVYTGVASFPQFTIKGLRLLGPDVTTATSGNGFVLRGNGSTFIPVHVIIDDLIITGFRGSGKAGMWLDGPEFVSVNFLDAINNDIGLKLTGAFAAGVLSNIRLESNLSYGGYLSYNSGGEVTSLVWNQLTVEDNIKTGLFMSGVYHTMFNGCHFEANNLSGTSGEYATKLVGVAGHYVNDNTFNNCVWQGGDQFYTIGNATGYSSFNRINNSVTSSAGSPFAIIGNVYTSTTFDSTTARSGVNDLYFTTTILNDTITGRDYFPNGYSTGYAIGARELQATSIAVSPGTIAPGSCSTTLFSAANSNIATGSLIGVRGTSGAYVTNISSYVGSLAKISVYPTTDSIYLDICNPTASAITTPSNQIFTFRISQ